jgi:4-hydroxyphenylpyruvate dioxygenase
VFRSIATVSLGGTLADKLTAIAAAGFDGLEIFENDLLYFDGTPADVRHIAGDLGLRIVLFQPFRDFEAGPRERLQRNLDRAERKFDVMEQLEADLMLVCSSVAPDATNDDALAAADLHELGQRAARRGLRIGYEALCWGRHVNTWRHAWKIVQEADHPAVGLVVDSFHTLAIRDDDSGIAEVPGERIFMAQIADAPLIQLDPLSWSRHFRLFPGQGAFPLARFMRNVIASGYGGPVSLEIFNDEFRAAPPRPTAIDAMRSLILLEEELIAESGVKPASPVVAGMLAPPAPPQCHGFEFVEFAVDAETRPRLAAMFDAMGFTQAGVHRSKDVSLHSQGDVHLILNAEKDSFAHSYFLVHGPSVCALAFQVDDAQRATERALRYKAQIFRGRVGPNELVIPAIRGLEGSLVYLVDRFGAEGTIYDVDFVAPPTAADDPRDCGLRSIDHVAQVMPRGQLDGALLFYRSVFGFQAEPAFELIDPYGLIQSRVVENADRTVRIPLNASLSPNTTSARFVATYSGAGVHHIAMTTEDIFATMRTMRARHVPLLDIPANYYENLAALYDLPPEQIEEMRRLSILYDRTSTGEFFHAYTLAFDGRFFFEFVERRGYDGFGAANASVRLAAQAMHDTARTAPRMTGQTVP